VAFFAPVDPMRDVARGWFGRNSDRLVTSDYIVDEVVMLLKTRYSMQSAIRAGETLLGERVSTFVYLLPDDIRRAPI
jgi:predicted nucleic acid-binding protein